jgi:nicotinamidase-related amidase
MLEDFVRGSLKCERAEKIIPKIKMLLEKARTLKIPVIYLNDSHLPQVDFEVKFWGPHAIVGTKGAQVIGELKPKPSDFIVSKRRYSGFFETNLDLLLRELKAEKIVLTGIHTHLCVLHTAADAFYRNYKLIIPIECVEASSEEEHRMGLRFMEKFYGAKIVKLKDVLSLLFKQAR